MMLKLTHLYETTFIKETNFQHQQNWHKSSETTLQLNINFLFYVKLTLYTVVYNCIIHVGKREALYFIRFLY